MVSADARVIIPPATQATIANNGVPAFWRTIPGFKNTPEPIIIPTTIAMASSIVTFFLSFPLIG